MFTTENGLERVKGKAKTVYCPKFVKETGSECPPYTARGILPFHAVARFAKHAGSNRWLEENRRKVPGAPGAKNLVCSLLGPHYRLFPPGNMWCSLFGQSSTDCTPLCLLSFSKGERRVRHSRGYNRFSESTISLLLSPLK